MRWSSCGSTIYGGAVRRPLRPDARDGQAVGSLLHLGAELAQLGGHRRQPVALLDAQVGDVHDAGGAGGERRQGGERGHLVGHAREVGFDGAELPAPATDQVSPFPLHRGAHRGEQVQEAGGRPGAIPAASPASRTRPPVSAAAAAG